MLKFDTLAASNFSYFKEDIPTLFLRRKSTQKITVDIWNLDYYFPPAKPTTKVMADGRMGDEGRSPQP